MKGIIAEVHSSYMIVIAKNGDFVKCKKLPNLSIGDEINIPVKNMKSIYKRLSTVAASFLILVMLSSGVYAYYTPYSYVSIDINPSLELYVNRFEKVIGAHAFNEEAKQVIEASKGIKNKNVDAALEQILDSATEAGYLKENAENSVMIVVSAGNAKEEAALTAKIKKTSTAVLSNISSNYELILEKTQVENYKKAKKDNVSPGKVMLANQLKEVKPEIDEEEIKHMPLQQAIKQIEKKEDKKENKEEDKEVKPNTPVTTNSEKPKPKVENNSNVMNIKELIKEKNEDLGNKLEKDNNSNKDEDKIKDKNDQGKDKAESDESFNQVNDEDSKGNADKQQEKDGQDNNSSKDKNDKNGKSKN